MELKTFYNNLGQSYEIVLKRMMGKEEFLYSLLSRFAADTTMNDLEAVMKSCDAAKIFNQAHTLKGVAENLGLKPLYEKTSALVEITRKGSMEGADEAFKEVKQAYREVVEMLQSITFNQ
ncbi:MAG: Hpt domain-containing protein [Clostridiales bacterium]|nr:Hpt domain-containing protein [Clostridiales bacterium]